MDQQPLTPAAIAAGLGTSVVPRTISCHGSVGSTMDLARELLARLDESQLPALVVADEQTAGRGRLGRQWVAPPATALLLSLALRPTWLAPERGVTLVWLAAVALCEAVEELTPLRPVLKWPNDLLVPARRWERETATLDELPHDEAPQASANRDQGPAQGRPPWAKAAGILLEMSIGRGGLETAVIGCGVNLRAAPPPGATRYPATSLAEAAGTPVSRLELLRGLLRRADLWHGRLRAGDEETLFAAWRGRLQTIGQEVRIETPGGLLVGQAIDVERSGALIVRDGAGRLHSVTAGDVGLLPQ